MARLFGATSFELVSQTIVCAAAEASQGSAGEGAPASLSLAVLDKLFEVRFCYVPLHIVRESCSQFDSLPLPSLNSTQRFRTRSATRRRRSCA